MAENMKIAMKKMYNIYELSKCLNCYTMENLLEEVLHGVSSEQLHTPVVVILRV